MSKHFGVVCKNCDTAIIIETLDEFSENEITFYAMPLTPTTCQKCDHSHLYEAKDKLEFAIPGETN